VIGRTGRSSSVTLPSRATTWALIRRRLPSGLLNTTIGRSDHAGWLPRYASTRAMPDGERVSSASSTAAAPSSSSRRITSARFAQTVQPIFARTSSSQVSCASRPTGAHTRTRSSASINAPRGRR
jgi:hypothetical protein